MPSHTTECDPAVKSPWLWLVDGKIVGADAVRESALKNGNLDYEAPIPGLEVVDRYTLRVRLKEPDLRFLYVFAIPNTAHSSFQCRSGKAPPPIEKPRHNIRHSPGRVTRNEDCRVRFTGYRNSESRGRRRWAGNAPRAVVRRVPPRRARRPG